MVCAGLEIGAAAREMARKLANWVEYFMVGIVGLICRHRKVQVRQRVASCNTKRSIRVPFGYNRES